MFESKSDGTLFSGSTYAARERFEQATRRAMVEQLLAVITGQRTDLLPFDEVRKILKAHQQIEAHHAQMIPLDRIVGSVGRYRDFTRTFLPRAGTNRERWVRINAAMDRMETLPPIEVYKVGDVYFVRDGNHRVSVARANGLKEIEAYVTEIPLPEGITVTPDMDLNDLIQQVEYREFLDHTGLDQIRPGADVRLTEPGRYPMFKEHIDVHRYYLGLERKAPVPYEEAVASWYDNVYMPVVEKIREMNILREFPGRTEADLYLWIAHHREELREHYGLPAPPQPDIAVATFAESHSDLPVQKVVKTLRRTISMVLGGTPDRLLREEIPELPTEEGAASTVDSVDRIGDRDESDGQWAAVQLPTEWGWTEIVE